MFFLPDTFVRAAREGIFRARVSRMIEREPNWNSRSKRGSLQYFHPTTILRRKCNQVYVLIKMDNL
jgi:hypothetical protein